MRSEIARLIDGAGLTSSYTPEDVLDVCAMMKVVTGNVDIRQTVPKDVRDIDARLGVFLYPTPKDRDRIASVKKKRPRKPSASCPSS